MRKFLALYVFTAFSVVVFAHNTPIKPADKMNQTKKIVTDQLFKLEEIDKIIDMENLTYEQLAEKYPDLLEETPVAPKVEKRINTTPDPPAGIPGFVWGFCLSWVGILIVYLSMDEGQGRKDQVKNALLGCIFSGAIYIFYYLLLGALYLWADAGQGISCNTSLSV